MFSALALAADVRTGGQDDVVTAQTGELGDAQTRLNCKSEQGVVTPPDPGVFVGDGENRFNFRFAQERNDALIEPFLWDGQNA